MDIADRIISQPAAERNLLVKHFNIDGRISMFAPLQQEAGDGDGDGKLKFGDAIPASLTEPSDP